MIKDEVGEEIAQLKGLVVSDESDLSDKFRANCRVFHNHGIMI